MPDFLPCRWRGPEVSVGKSFCGSPRFTPPEAGVTTEDCAMCTFRDLPTPQEEPESKMLTCVHLGESTGETRACETCGGKRVGKLKVFGCSKVGETTAAICKTCELYEAKPTHADSPSLTDAATSSRKSPSPNSPPVA